MIVQLTNERNTTLNWKDSGNSQYRRRYCIMIIIIVIIDVTMLGLVLVFTRIIRSSRYSLIFSWNLSFVITDEQEQKRPDDRIRVCVHVHE
jgi:flagellar basal body-associated protein FliL